jgi:hypothetical protein
LVLGLAVVLTQPVLAQGQRQRGQGGGRGPGQGGLSGLLSNESVQKELKLDESQIEKIKAAVTKVTDAHKDDFAKLRDLPQEERRTKGQEIGKTITEEVMKAATDVLKPEQIARLKQIELQTAGTQAFSRPDVQKALNLTDKQQEAIKTINDDAAKARREIAPQGGGGGGNNQETRDKLTALRKETAEKIQGVLTDAQKKTWKDMVGETFQIQRGGRRGGAGAGA